MAALTAMVALGVVALGAYVRLRDAGLACPDWPGCFGHLVVPSNTTQVMAAREAFPGVALQHEKAWIEMIHRYGAAGLGLLILGLFVLDWRARMARVGKSVLPAVLLALVIGQALLGMLTVTEQLRPVIVTLHLFGGMSTLALLVWLTLRHMRWRSAGRMPASLRVSAAAALAVLLLQIVLGGWTSANAAGLSCPDFPTCQGEWLPAMDFSAGFDVQRHAPLESEADTLAALTAIHWAHRLGALATTLLLMTLFVLTYSRPVMRRLAGAMLALLIVQIALGIANALMGTPLSLALLHNVVAATLLITVVALNYRIWAGPTQEEIL